MAGELKYTVFTTDAGWVGILGGAGGLLTITFPRRSEPEAYRLLGDTIKQATISPRLFADLMERLKAYFRGQQVTFPDKIDLSGATPFQREVWQKTRLIAYGETRSYAWVANQVGKPKAARAVGQALGSNPLPIIVPCHRVVASDGNLGGFSGGIEMKRSLLRLEAAGRG